MTADNPEDAREQTKPDRTDDLRLVKKLEAVILRRAKGPERFGKEIPLLLRRAIDEVVDAPRTGRFLLDEIEKTEKTYLGTKVEVLLRYWLGFPKGRVLDLLVGEDEVDIKNTMKSTWMIPIEAVDRPCILVKTDEDSALFSFGLIIARMEYLGAPNRDKKRPVTKFGRSQAHWIIQDEPYPKNLWLEIPPEVRSEIASFKSGSKRVDALFRLVQGKPIPRSLILGIAPQLDSMKRVRKNGGARDSLAKKGIVLLSGNYDCDIIRELKLPNCTKGEFISYTPKNDEEKLHLRTLVRIK
jgi:hypothetical protein